ncbi:MAG: alpha/beta hydrolase [Terriglobales bacterium]
MLTVKRLVRMLLYFLVLAYLALVLVGIFFSDKLIFQPQRSSYKDSAEITKIQTAHGERISAIYLGNPTAKFTILYSHGNAEDIGDLRPWLDQLQASGFSVFAYDYEGYGTSEGTPSEKNVYADVNAAYAYLTNTLDIPPARIISYGRSVGNGASIDLASRQRAGGLIVQSGFTSAFVVLTKVPLVPFDKFRNISKIPHVKCPVMVIHGRRDNVIPFSNGERLFAAAPEPKENFWVENAGHNDLEFAVGEELIRKIQAFSHRLLQAPQ